MQPLIERYPVGLWTIVAGTSSTQGGVLAGIACDSLGACWAVGRDLEGEHLIDAGGGLASSPNVT
jgi:hypothetical protein